MKGDDLRNFTVRFLESTLHRVDTTAKPFYGGRLSTGEAIRRLAEERLNEIESSEAVEQSGEALLRILADWRSGRVASITDLRFLASSAAAAYGYCQADFVRRDLLMEVMRAFRDVARAVQHRKALRTIGRRYPLPVLEQTGNRTSTRVLSDAVERWIDALPTAVTSHLAAQASRNLSAFLRDEEWPDELPVCRALRPYMGLLLQLSIRAHWYRGRQPLVGPEEYRLPSGPRNLKALHEGRIVLEPTILDQDLSLTVTLLGSDSGVRANNLVEIEDLRSTVRLALQGKEVRGEVFAFTPAVQAAQISVTADNARWMLEISDCESLARALDRLVGEPSVSSLLERGRFVYGQI